MGQHTTFNLVRIKIEPIRTTPPRDCTKIMTQCDLLYDERTISEKNSCYLQIIIIKWDKFKSSTKKVINKDKKRDGETPRFCGTAELYCNTLNVTTFITTRIVRFLKKLDLIKRALEIVDQILFVQETCKFTDSNVLKETRAAHP